eukprot:CAMPEP_0194238918 /NCGR_PEP_ID=MMETSP0158-20130606/5536_1 /TAXON_ID=33649 /ORGANISM="Thalassionema nitzschioides, Strain L26-B" /LENGTH=561 /DNA_ID=CAMNT_0038973277 /DNA_START=51 /DNA_END=1733 /DNA_ORIENTATION=-
MRFSHVTVIFIIWVVNSFHVAAVARYERRMQEGIVDDLPWLDGRSDSAANTNLFKGFASFGGDNRLGGSVSIKPSHGGRFKNAAATSHGFGSGDGSRSQPNFSFDDNGGKNGGFGSRDDSSSGSFGFAGTMAQVEGNTLDGKLKQQQLTTTDAAAAATCPNGPVTYFPGNLTVTLGGGGSGCLASSTILASTGLTGRVLTRSGQAVALEEGARFSPVTMHSYADGAATVPDDYDPTSRYYLVSNSESRSGGVGILHLDGTKTPHDIIGYRRTAENTPTGNGRNCGGGRTPWGTWLSSEESSGGSVYEIDPNAQPAGDDYCRVPIVPDAGGFYEANAYWESTDDNKYHFYTTEDSDRNYRLTRFIPDDTIETMLSKPRKLDRLCNANGSLSYLKLVCTSSCRRSSSTHPSGTYSWDSSSRTPDLGDQPYPYAEGIDVKGNELYFVTKEPKRLYILDLSSNTWTSTGTIQSDDGSALFSADQVARITGSNSPDDLLYFAEDGAQGTQDIHARGVDPTSDNGEYKFFTIIQGYTTTETTGLTFSPDNKYMYFTHQENSEIWQIW